MTKVFIVIEKAWDEQYDEKLIKEVFVFPSMESAQSFVAQSTRPLTKEELHARWERYADWAHTEEYWQKMLSKIDETKINHNEFLIYEREM